MPVAHGTSVVGVKPSPPHEPAQHTSADAGLDRGDIGLAELGQFADAQFPIVEVEQCIDDTAAEMDVLVECAAEAMEEADSLPTVDTAPARRE